MLPSPKPRRYFSPHTALPCCCCCCTCDMFSPAITSEQISLSKRVQAKGGTFLEAPVSGSKGQAAGVGDATNGAGILVILKHFVE